MRIGKTSAVLAALAVAAFASSSNAEVFSKTASPTVTGGTVVFSTGLPATLSQSTTIQCKVSATLNVVAGPTGSADATLNPANISSPPNAFCGVVVYAYGSWSAHTALPALSLPYVAGTVLLKIGANTILGDPCYDVVRVPVSSSTSSAGFDTITLNNVKLKTVSGSANQCTVNAVLKAPSHVHIF
ncbi:hypothetical protein D3C80_826690 [compost metagenome]